MSCTLHILCNLKLCSLEVTVGFQRTELLTSEVAGTVEVCVIVTNGTLGRDVVSSLVTMNGESRQMGHDHVSGYSHLCIILHGTV